MHILKMFLLITAICIGCTSSDRDSLYPLQDESSNASYIPDENTASKIAEAIWLPIYGQSIYGKKPFKVTLVKDSIWEVEGSLKSGYDGGVPYIRINKRTCEIIEVTHSK